MTEAERQEKIPEYATLIVGWFHSTGLAHCDWELFWEQVNSALYGGFPWLFKDEAPKPNGTIPDQAMVKAVLHQAET